ncbi:MAG: hypothetical protein ACI8XO_004703 [Verrucomicrobiales bacterium]|jgi:hypothetical protein
MILVPQSSVRTAVYFFAAILLFLPLAHSQEITVVDDTTNTTLTDGQATVIDFGCTKPGVPVSRTFTVSNSDVSSLVLPANGLSLPSGYSLNPAWPTASVTPEFLFEVNSAGGGVVTGDEFRLSVVSAPSVISVIDVTVTIPLDPAGTSPPETQLPYVDSDGDALVSTTGTSAGIDTDPVSLGNWSCPTPGAQSNPNGDICFEYADQIFTTGPSNRFNRKRTFITRVTAEKLTGSLASPATNGVLQYGVAVEQLNPPAIPGGGDNGDGDNYGIGGIEITITVFNSLTNATQVITGELVDDGIDNDHSEITLFSDPVLVPVPVILGQNQSFPLTVQLDAVIEGAYPGNWSLENNDADENPFNFPITGLVDGTNPTIVGLSGNLSFPSVGASCEAMISWTAPTAADNLDPAPTITQTNGPTSGATVTVGVYTIEYTAEDCAGNIFVGSFSVTVSDTTAPTLVGSLPKQIIRSTAPGTTSVIVNYPALTANDDCDPNPTVNCTPPSGSVFTLGLTQVCCVAVDSSGNMSAQACFNVIVIEGQPSPAPRVFEEITKRGGPAPGVAGATMNHTYHAFINEAGGIAIHSRIDNAGVNNFGIWKDVGAGLELVAQEGDVVPGLAFPLNAFDEYILNEAGDVAFEASLKNATSTTDRAHFNDAVGSTALSINEGGTAPGSGAIFKVVQEEAFDSLGNSYSPAKLLIGTAAVTSANDAGIWRKPAGALEELAREGNPSPLAGINYGNIAGRVVANESGQVAFYSFLQVTGAVTTANNAAIFSGEPGSLTVVSREGDVAPGPAAAAAVFQTYAAESINNAGRVAFEASLRTGSGTPISSSNNTGLYTNSNGAVELVAREGDLAPCLAGTAGNFSSFRDIFIAENGDVYFRVFLKGGAVDSSSDGSFWRWQATDQTLHPILREGDPAPSTQGAVFLALTDFAVSNDGVHAVSATLVIGTGDCVSLNNSGVWMDDGNDGLPILKMRRGDTSDIGLGNATDPAVTLVRFDKTTNSAGGSGGHGKVVNDAGEIVVRMSFNQNSTGAFVLGTTVP